MAGFGKRGKRGGGGGSSSSSYVSAITIIIFVALCLVGVWMLTSSSVIPSHATTSRLSSLSSSSSKGGESKSETKVGEEFEDHHPVMMHHHHASLVERTWSDEEPQKQQHKEEEKSSGSGGGDEEAQQLPKGDEETTGEHNQQQEDHDSDGIVMDGGSDQKQETQLEQEESQQINEEQENSQPEKLEENEGDGQQRDHQQTDSEIEENKEPRSDKVEEAGDNQTNRIDQQIEENEVNSEQQKEENVTNENDANEQQHVDNEGEKSQSSEEDNDSSQSEEKLSDHKTGVSLPNVSQSEEMSWATQEDHSDNEKERRREEAETNGGDLGNILEREWELCNVTTGPDYIPCLDNQKAIKKLHIRHYEHRERHCPEDPPTCLVPLPPGYKRSIEWPKSRDRIWYSNVPHTKLAEVKGHQNWVKVTGEYLTFPGGGTQFIHGALHYIDFIQQALRTIAWGKHTRVILDVGCGVASFGGYLFERDVLAMSFAPKDEHEAQVQFALERGVPAISAVMGSQRLQFPSRVFDLVHCARCRVPWHADGGTLLLELNRVLRPGGYFVWSATPVYQKLKEDVEIWKAMTSLTKSMCWEQVTIKKDRLNGIAAAIYRKPTSNDCYEKRGQDNPPMCKADDDPNAAWYIPLQACMHRVPVEASERGTRWPEEWPRRLEEPPYWLNSTQIGVYGKPAPEDFKADYEHWKHVVMKTYLSDLGINWAKVRNVMDMRAVYGGFAAALRDVKVWVMNVVNIDSPDTLPIIYERGLFGIYHDWCESFSTYPRTYDLLHADHLFSRLKKRCDILPLVVEVDRIVRPGGKLIVRDESKTVTEVEYLLKSLHWEVRLTSSKDQEGGVLYAEKSDWRPERFADFSLS